MLQCIAHEGHSDSLHQLRWQDVPSDARVVFALDDSEERASPEVWRQGMELAPDRCVVILQGQDTSIRYRISGTEGVVGLTDASSLTQLLGMDTVYIDVSGMSHGVWAPLLKAAINNCKCVRVIYFEPAEYSVHPSPTSASLFKLSVEFKGIHPIPGFANLMGPADESTAIFVPFLGFEGPRSRQVAMSLDPIPSVIPVIGLPGFRIEYPQVTLACNQEFLRENSAERRVRFARANCPFEAYSVLAEIRRDNPDSYLYVAPIGTKPHAVGAIMYAMDNPTNTEIMYDHPVKSFGRTTGIGTIHIFHIKG